MGSCMLQGYLLATLSSTIDFGEVDLAFYKNIRTRNSRGAVTSLY